jgi:hypothetical protein
MQFADLSSLATLDVHRLYQEMNDQGVAVIDRVVLPEKLAEARAFVERHLEKHNHQYFSYSGAQAVAGSLMEELGQLPAFAELLAKLYALATGTAEGTTPVYQVLRVLKGSTGRKQAFRFHYDAYVVTAVLPIVIPSAACGPTGDLVLYPRLRPIRSNNLVNLIEKVFMQNALAQWIMSREPVCRLLRAKVYRLQPGNLYLFWGYQSLHANQPCRPESLRATAVFHLGNPHLRSRLVNLIQQARVRREAQRREKLKR